MDSKDMDKSIVCGFLGPPCRGPGDGAPSERPGGRAPVGVGGAKPPPLKLKAL